MIGAKFKGLRARFLLLVIAIYVLVGVVSLFGFYRVAENIISHLGASYATQYANQQRGRIMAKVERELVLTQKLVGSPLLHRWAKNETDPELKRAALEELESFRTIFADHSYFFAIDSSRDYYTNNAANEFGGKEFRFVLNPDDKTMGWYFATMQHVDDFDLHVDYDAQLDVTKIWINAIVKEGTSKIAMGGTGLDLSEFLKSIVHTTEPGVENVLIDVDGFVQGHSDPALMETIAHTTNDAQRLTIFKLIDSEAEQSTLRQMLLRMKNGEIQDGQTVLTMHGEPRLAAISYMPEIHWAAIVLVDPSQVIRLETFRPIVFLMAAALLITILLVSWLLDRLVLTRLARLIALTRDIAAGQYDRKLAVDRNDEIGQLTHSFNAMTTTIGDYMQNLEQKVSDRTEQLQRSNALLESSNRKIMDSIEYARLIQSSILAKREDLSALLRDYAVLWQPRDVVGGDFYSLHRAADGGFLLTVADCTGHGVPGAFMTMASKALFDHAVAARGMHDPAAVINELHRGLRALLQSRYANETDNGLDIALLYVSPQRKKLVFAAAKLSLWIIERDGRFIAMKGDRQSAGYRKNADEIHYTNHEIIPSPGQRFILLTDGILDQHGGENDFGFGQVRLREMLSAWHDRPLAQLADALATRLKDYRGELPQRDDITLLGFSLD